MAADARGRGDRVRADTLDAFCDALWLEDGLSKNSIAAYRADLEQLAAFTKKPITAVEEIRGTLLALSALVDKYEARDPDFQDQVRRWLSSTEALLSRNSLPQAGEITPFLRVALERHDPADVARDLGMTVNAVYLARSRVMRRIREEYDGVLDD